MCVYVCVCVCVCPCVCVCGCVYVYVSVCALQICDFGLARLRDLNNTMTANVGTVQVRIKLY